jgi:hypothetical protein
MRAQVASSCSSPVVEDHEQIGGIDDAIAAVGRDIAGASAGWARAPLLNDVHQVGVIDDAIAIGVAVAAKGISQEIIFFIRDDSRMNDRDFRVESKAIP